MLTSSDIPRLLTAGLKTQFQKGYDGIKTIYQDFTTEVLSTKAEENYGWLGDNPQMQEWIDERAPKGLLENGFSLKNKDYEATIAVDRNALDDDQYGQIKTRVTALGATAKKGYDKFAVKMIEAGHTSVCYDGQNYFDTDHAEGTSGTQSNYSASGKALTADNLKSIITTMGDYKTDTGEIAGVNPTHIMVPTALEFTAKEMLDPAYVSVSTDPAKASLKGRLQVVVNPYLTSNGANSAYYVMDLSNYVKPFIFQNRKAITFDSLEKGERAFMSKRFHYGVDARFAFGYGDWRLCYKAQG